MMRGGPNISVRNILSRGVEAPVFSPSDLPLTLNLRTPNAALTTTTRANNGFVVLADNLGTNPDVCAVLDQAQGLNLNSIYTSDFSSGTDGMSGQNSTVTGNIDGIGGENDTLRIVGNDVAGAVGAFQLITGADDVLYVSFRAYKPTTSTTVTHMSVTTGSVISKHHFELPDDEWVDCSCYLYSTDTTVYFQFSNGTSSGAFDDNGDTVYLKDISISTVDGYHFVQGTPANMPHWNNTNFTLTFNGIAHRMADHNGFFTAVASDEIGELINVFDDTAGSGTYVFPFTITDVSAGAVHILAGLEGVADKYAIFNNNATNLYEISTVRGSRTDLTGGSTGSAFFMLKEDISMTRTGGTDSDDGNWIADDVNYDTATLGAAMDSSPNYYTMEWRGTFYKSGANLTSEQRSDFKTWRDSNI